MSTTVTITGKVGPALTLTAGVFTGVTDIDINTVTNICSFVQSNGLIAQVDVTAATTITATKSGSAYTLTIS